MMTLTIIGATFVGIGAVSVAIWSFLNTRRKYPSPARIDATAEKVYAAVIDFICSASSEKPMPEDIPPFKQLPDETKDIYRGLAKRYFF